MPNAGRVYSRLGKQRKPYKIKYVDIIMDGLTSISSAGYFFLSVRTYIKKNNKHKCERNKKSLAQELECNATNERK